MTEEHRAYLFGLLEKQFGKMSTRKRLIAGSIIDEAANLAAKELQEELDYAKNNCLFSDCTRVARLNSRNTKLEEENKQAKTLMSKVLSICKAEMSPFALEAHENVFKETVAFLGKE